MPQEYINALIGGGIIGVAATLMLFFNGRVTGIAGILSTGLKFKTGEMSWRWLFILGLVTGGVILQKLQLGIIGEPVVDEKVLILAGILVGVGTVMGSGCTSGHAVCGLSRLSKRSIIATLVFISVGMATASIVSLLAGKGV